MSSQPSSTGQRKKLRSGYTTGACAAAAARAAVAMLLAGAAPATVTIPFPDTSRHRFPVAELRRLDEGQAVRATIVKDAGDDPDVTNGAAIVATVWQAPAAELPAGHIPFPAERICLTAGTGVGRVTKPGLAVPVGEPAINPVPRQMIRAAVLEVWRPDAHPGSWLVVEISVPRGEALAARTLNHRLGIVGGLSILGTTGIVRPVSAAAWQATIVASLDVARAVGLDQVVLSTGRTSERAVFSLLHLPEEAGVMMGDYLEFSLLQAGKRGFSLLHLAGMWAKILKGAMGVPQTHVRHGALEVAAAVDFLADLGLDRAAAAELTAANTAREIHSRLLAMDRDDLVRAVCRRARDLAAAKSGVPVSLYLVNAAGEVEVQL